MAGKTSKGAIVDLEIVMLGKTGNGKSATGNSLLWRKAFTALMKSGSVTQKVRSEYADHGEYRFKVIDTPGTADTELSMLQDKERTIKNMGEVFMHCNIGVNVFLLVVRLDTRITEEERAVFTTFKGIFGDRYLEDHGIVAVTHGDVFGDKMEEEELNLTFEEWIRLPTLGPLGKLFKECGYRCVLFDNRTKNDDIKKQQFQKLLDFAEPLRRKGIYTNDTFKTFDKDRKRLILELKLPILKKSIQKKINLIRSHLDVLTEKSTGEDVNRIECDADALLEEIKEQDQGTSMLKDLQKSVENIRKRCHRLKELIKDNKLREAKMEMDEMKKQSQLLKEQQNAPPSFWHSWKGIAVKYFSAALFGAGMVGATVLTGGAAALAAGATAASAGVALLSNYSSGKADANITKKT